MAFYYKEVSRTFSEYLLVPNLTRKDCIPSKVSLKTPIVKFKKDEEPPIEINIPFVSAIMQSVSDDNLAIALSKCGGLSFIFGSQPIEEQAEMVSRVKNFKAGFVVSNANLSPEQTLKDVVELKSKLGHATIAITEDGTLNSKLVGIVTSRDYRMSRDPLDRKIKEFMTPFSKLIVSTTNTSLKEANDIIWEHKLNCLPIINDQQHLAYFVFRKDYEDHKENPLQLLDSEKRYMVGAGINTRDYKERVPALVKAGVDVLCVDSSDGFSEWQAETIKYIKEEYKDSVKIGGGNVVDKEGFMFFVEAGADFVKVGIGGGSICITRETKGIGRGQASAVIEVAQARDDYFKETGIYIPICSDGGVVHDYHMVLALAMGADFIMMGRYFARFDESPAPKTKLGNNYVKEYWGEGSKRARNWERYDLGEGSNLKFEEGVDSYVPYAGKLKDNIDVTLSKIKSTLCSCGAISIKELQKVARITLVSSTSIVEGGAHDVILKENNY
ncbi:IMP dehydrogenase [Pelosinus propionicus]|uniref:IMP dehydrogenase n=1 Tax=Pelosinus propionicus DSM 13327 TaxID=1123291 RepID=A0A1I4I4H9_9FIRM|nr:IMP dehydrogenase [Pelosinus propionicus]SFL49219.1 IMP dehydrogenase [Pelosinus propionicus DSM 13327]